MIIFDSADGVAIGARFYVEPVDTGPSVNGSRAKPGAYGGAPLVIRNR